MAQAPPDSAVSNLPDLQDPQNKWPTSEQAHHNAAKRHCNVSQSVPLAGMSDAHYLQLFFQQIKSNFDKLLFCDEEQLC